MKPNLISLVMTTKDSFVAAPKVDKEFDVRFTKKEKMVNKAGVTFWFGNVSLKRE